MGNLERFRAVIAEIDYRDDWAIGVYADGTRCYLQVQFVAACVVTGQVGMQSGRKWLLSPHMTTTEIVVTALKACIAAEEHEARERFRFREQRVFSPHIDVEWVAEQMSERSIESVRTAPSKEGGNGSKEGKEAQAD